MKGQNPIRQQDLNPEGRLWVQEVFYTLQGEGPFTGEPAVFIRLAGCNLKCFWCDTEFESSGWTPALPELLERVEALRPPSCSLVVITGGEPFRQNIAPLVEALLGRDLRVQIETNGTLWVDLPDDDKLTIVCSPKTPTINATIARRAKHFKYVICNGQTDPDDGLPLMGTQREDVVSAVARPPEGAQVHVMPLDEADARLNLLNRDACVAVAKRHGYRLTLQTHKILSIQ